MRILLITPSNAGGHHNEYKILLAKAFSELGHEVLHFPQNSSNIKTINKSIPSFFLQYKFLTKPYLKYQKYVKELWQIRKNALTNWNVLFNHITYLQDNSYPPDLLFFECLDVSIGQYLTKKDIDKRLRIPFSGILISPNDTSNMTKSFFRKGFFDPYHLLKSKWCLSIAVLMDEAGPLVSSLVHKPVIVLPDIVSNPVKVQDNSLRTAIRTRAKGRFTFGIWGSLEQRKGTTEFLQTCLTLPKDNYFFVMGGCVHHDGWPEKDKIILDEILLGIHENIIVFDKWLTDDELLSGMKACDLIFAAYPHWRFSSGIVGKAAAVGVPILVNDGFVMARRVNDFNIGFVKQEQDDTSTWLSNNIDSIKKLRTSTSFRDGCLKYCESNSFEKWCKSLKHLIEPQKS